jgi:hypothetical protein
MSIALRPITAEEFQTWRDSSLENYAAEKIKQGLNIEDAREEAKKSFDKHLSEGPNSKILSSAEKGLVAE